jgi:hypothetical protein
MVLICSSCWLWGFLRNKIIRWLGNQHRRRWKDLGNAQRQARELISGPCRGTKVRILSFNRIQSRVNTGLLTGHNTLRKHPHLVGLTDRPLCRKCGAQDETSAHILCRCEALACIRLSYLGSFFLEPGDIMSIGLGAIWSLSKAAGLHWEFIGAQGPRCFGALSTFGVFYHRNCVMKFLSQTHCTISCKRFITWILVLGMKLSHFFTTTTLWFVA